MEPQRDVIVAGHPNNRLYIDSGASVHILFNPELLSGLVQLDRVIKIQACDKQFIYHKFNHYTRHCGTYCFL